MVFRAFDLWSCLMFPGESASRGDLGGSPVSWTLETLPSTVRWLAQRPQRAWRMQALPSWAASPDSSHRAVFLSCFHLSCGMCCCQRALAFILVVSGVTGLTLCTLLAASGTFPNRQCWPALPRSLWLPLPMLCTLSLPSGHIQGLPVGPHGR